MKPLVAVYTNEMVDSGYRLVVTILATRISIPFDWPGRLTPPGRGPHFRRIAMPHRPTSRSSSVTLRHRRRIRRFPETRRGCRLRPRRHARPVRYGARRIGRARVQVRRSVRRARRLLRRWPGHPEAAARVRPVCEVDEQLPVAGGRGARPGRLPDMSCTGAETKHMTKRQHSNPPQFSALGPDTRLVTLTIGGNDPGSSRSSPPARSWGCSTPAARRARRRTPSAGPTRSTAASTRRCRRSPR